VVEVVRDSGAPQRALERAQEYASAASDQLDAIEAGEARDALAALTDYVVSRKL
jgi:geranylgeranyl pyrophosphate synthase